MKPNKERRYFGLFLCVCRGHRREEAGEKFGFMPIFRRARDMLVLLARRLQVQIWKCEVRPGGPDGSKHWPGFQS